MAFATQKIVPFIINGMVIRGFGRGSKELGIPTANLPMSSVEQLPDSVNCGIYYGWAQVDSSPIYKMVMSIGWNPYYKNEKKSVEVHILHKFENDFYGSMLKVCTLGYIRPERNFSSIDELVAEIRNDIAIAEATLTKPDDNMNLNCKKL